MRLACSRRADSSFLVAGSLPMAEGSLWVWNFPQSNLGDKTQTRHTTGPMEKKPQRERIAFRRPGPNSRASPAAPLASRRQPSKLASPAPATRPSPSASAPPAPAPLSTLARPSRSACRLAPSLPQALPLRRASALRPRTPATPVFSHSKIPIALLR